MDYSLPGFSVHEIFQARVPEWVAICDILTENFDELEVEYISLQKDRK